MERLDSVILISPNIGVYYDQNVFLRGLDQDELNYVQGSEFVIEYRKRHTSYEECLKDLRDKIKKIQLILEEE